MSSTRSRANRDRCPIVRARLVLLTLLLTCVSAQAQSPYSPASLGFPISSTENAADTKTSDQTAPNPANELVPVVDQNIKQVSCPSCNSPIIGGSEIGPGGCAGCASSAGAGHLGSRLFTESCGCSGGACVPGREGQCYYCDADHTAVHRFLFGLYECLCCPDPCYEPKWLPIADAAFFVAAARPVTQTRLRWDRGLDLILPDRSEYFWARADGNGKGPSPRAPALVVPRLNYHDLSMYIETGTGAVSVIVETPYRSINPDFAAHAAGFGDVKTGLKTMIFDCELLQVSTILTTYIPAGSSGKGLGTGHVSLEPSLVFAIKLNKDAYLQGQLSEWIPLGGDQLYAGAVFNYHFSYNQTLVRVLPNVPLIGTLEMSGYSFQDGAFTDPIAGPFQESSNDSYIYAGAGLRLFVCDRIDFGLGFQVPITDDHFSEQLYRSEFRFRY